MLVVARNLATHRLRGGTCTIKRALQFHKSVVNAKRCGPRRPNASA